MKTLKAVMATIIVSSFAVMTVIHLNMVKVEPVSHNTTLDMLKVMAEAFNEGGEGPGGGVEGSVCLQLTVPITTNDPSTVYPYPGCIDVVSYHYCEMAEGGGIIFDPIVETCVEGLSGLTMCNGIPVGLAWWLDGPNVYPCGDEEAH